MSFKIPLSYNPIPTTELVKVLETYKDQHHQVILDDFEKEICTITGSPYAVALNSGTSAIHLGLKLLGVGKGDLVICPTFTYIASVNPVLYLGAEAVFVDCELHTWCMDPVLLEEALTDLERKGNKPKAIVVVYAYGMPGRIDELVAIANKFEVPILEDAAEALGSTSKGRHMGTIGDVGIISFNNNKIVTTYGGGVLLVKTKEQYQQTLFWATQSRENKPYYEHNEVGFNYRMGPLNAGVGLAELKKLHAKVQNNRELQVVYQRFLQDFGAHFQEEQPDDSSNYWLTTCLKQGFSPSNIRQLFAKNQIEIRMLWNPMHQQPFFETKAHYLNGNADRVFNSGISLPNISSKDVDKLKTVKQTFKLVT